MIFIDVYGIDLLFFMQNVMKLPFKMTEKLRHTLGGRFRKLVCMSLLYIHQNFICLKKKQNLLCKQENLLLQFNLSRKC